MKPLTLDEILDLDRYEKIRDVYRRRVIAHKRDRRIAVGERVGIVFEDRETLRYQVQEMTRIERIRAAERVQDELDTYNELMPGENELSATLFIEVPELKQVRAELDRLIGIDEHVALVLGEGPDEETIPARFDPKQMNEERISAVQYIRFPFHRDQVDRFARGDRARLCIRHPHYQQESEFPPSLRASLLRGLRNDPPCLLDAAAEAMATPTEEVLYEDDKLRVVRPASAHEPDTLVIEALGPRASLLDLDAAQLGELMVVVQRYAREISQRSGGCRIATDIVGENSRLRWHLTARPG